VRQTDPKVGVKRAVALMNGRAGAFSQRHAADIEKTLKASFSRHGLEVEIDFIDGEDLNEAVDRARSRAERGEIAAVVIGGGDGSVRIAASVLSGSGVPLGIVPLGTLNHFAKDLGIPLRIEDAVAAIARKRVRAVDLAEVNGETFINNSSIGIYPYMVIDREARRARHKLAKWMAAVPAFLRMMRHFPRRRLRISAAGFERPYRTPCLFVGNNEYAVELFTLRRRKRLNSGKLWLYVVKPREPLEFSGWSAGFASAASIRRTIWTGSSSRKPKSAPRPAGSRWRSMGTFASCTRPCTIAPVPVGSPSSFREAPRTNSRSPRMAELRPGLGHRSPIQFS
jgi:diacylglycerol kinase family enzyme